MVQDVQCILTGVLAEECGSQLLLVVEEFLSRCFDAQVQRLKSSHSNAWRDQIIHVLRHPTTWDVRDVEEELISVDNYYRDVTRIYKKTFERYIDTMRTASERVVVHVTVPPFPVFLQKILQVSSRAPAFVNGDYFDTISVLSRRMFLADAIRLGLERCRLEYTNTSDVELEVQVDEWDSVSQVGMRDSRVSYGSAASARGGGSVVSGVRQGSPPPAKHIEYTTGSGFHENGPVPSASSSVSSKLHAGHRANRFVADGEKRSDTSHVSRASRTFHDLHDAPYAFTDRGASDAGDPRSADDALGSPPSAVAPAASSVVTSASRRTRVSDTATSSARSHANPVRIREVRREPGDCFDSVSSTSHSRDETKSTRSDIRSSNELSKSNHISVVM